MKENAIYIPNLNICVKDFYIKDKKVFLVNFDDSVSTSDYSFSDFQTNYLFNTETNICYIQKNDLLPNLGIYGYQFSHGSFSDTYSIFFSYWFDHSRSYTMIEVFNNDVFNYFLNVFSLFFVPIFIYVIALSFVK